MKITSSKENLLHVIQAVHRTSKSPVPILNTIKLEVKDGKLAATMTDIDLTLISGTTVTIDEEGEVCLPARQLVDIVRALPDTEIEIVAKDDSAMIIYNDSRISIKGYPVDQFPILPEMKESYSFQMSQGLLKEIVKQTAYAVSSDNTRPVLTGVWFDVSDNKLKFAATDAHRLALRETGIEVQGKNAIVPARALNELSKIMRGDVETVKITIGDHAMFATRDGVLITRLIAGHFPNYRQIIPGKFSASVTGKTNELIEAVARAFVLIDEESPVLEFSFDEESVVTVNTQTGSLKERLKVKYQGEPMKIYFNAKYLMDVLRAMPSDEMVLNLTNPLGAAVVKPAGKDDYLSLLLPARPKNEVSQTQDAQLRAS